eukprot:TRINITY_DN8560_c0_g1_i3.p1 TRINITY_DN8560_c0_g1~~TRINITY_DN8560_c0_g1_i3.p1  ORF type:complete len:109 (+),score=12.68 TRINITY_DN8560_c0_g1_i3:143-469(+)
MIRRPPRSTLSSSSAASDVYKRQEYNIVSRYAHASYSSSSWFLSSSEYTHACWERENIQNMCESICYENQAMMHLLWCFLALWRSFWPFRIALLALSTFFSILSIPSP